MEMILCILKTCPLNYGLLPGHYTMIGFAADDEIEEVFLQFGHWVLIPFKVECLLLT